MAAMSDLPSDGRCVDCDSYVRPAFAWAEVTGWTMRRSAGGANQVALRKPTGRYLCNACMVTRKVSGEIEQRGLF